jgi:hypothetical protein
MPTKKGLREIVTVKYYKKNNYSTKNNLIELKKIVFI